MPVATLGEVLGGVEIFFVGDAFVEAEDARRDVGDITVDSEEIFDF